MKSKSGLINTYSTYNIGDSAIYSAIGGLIPSPPAYGLIQDESPLHTPGFAPVRDPAAMQDCDVYISVGGDIFNNARPQLVTKAFLKNLNALRHKPRQTMVFGQSIPASCKGMAFMMLAHVFRRVAAVSVRDALSHQRLVRAGVEARLSYDFAFSLTASSQGQELADRTYADLGLEAENLGLISLRQFDQMYPHSNSTFIAKLAALAELLHAEGVQPALLVQSDAYGTDGDWAVAKQIQNQCAAQLPIVNAFANHAEIANWDHLLGLLAKVKLVVGVRYHTSVLRLVTGRMPYNLYYSIKGEDLSARLAVPGCSVADFDPVQALPEILATAEITFDSTAIAQQVQEDFNWAYQRALG